MWLRSDDKKHTCIIRKMFACSYYRRLYVDVDVWRVNSACSGRLETRSLKTLAWLSTGKSYVKTSPCVLTPEARTSSSYPKPLVSYNITACIGSCNGCIHHGSLSHSWTMQYWGTQKWSVLSWDQWNQVFLMVFACVSDLKVTKYI